MVAIRLIQLPVHPNTANTTKPGNLTSGLRHYAVVSPETSISVSVNTTNGTIVHIHRRWRWQREAEPTDPSALRLPWACIDVALETSTARCV